MPKIWTENWPGWYCYIFTFCVLCYLLIFSTCFKIYFFLSVISIVVPLLLESMIYFVGPRPNSLSFGGRRRLTWYQSTCFARSRVWMLWFAVVSPFVFAVCTLCCLCTDCTLVWVISSRASWGRIWGGVWERQHSRNWYFSCQSEVCDVFNQHKLKNWLFSLVQFLLGLNQFQNSKLNLEWT